MIKSNNTDKPLILGILGGGQLAKMLAQEAYKMGLQVAVIENGESSPAGQMTKFEFAGGWNCNDDLQKFIEISDIVTLENEFINPDILENIETHRKVYPAAQTMRKVQDKFIQKSVFSQFGIPVPHFAEVNSIDDALDFAQKHSYPFLLKTRTLGYDGYGNHTVREEKDIAEAFEKFTKDGVLRPLLAERFVSFDKELAVMVARNTLGETAIYPCVETIQKNHICHKVIAPADVSVKMSDKAKELALKCVESIDGVGVFGVELFACTSGEVLVNEIAPRPHNSGHYTIEACRTSQYENAIRAVLGLPLGSTEMLMPAACMINLLGERDGTALPTDAASALNNGKANLHLYGKSLSRKGRKMGHITALGKDRNEAVKIAEEAANGFAW